MNTQTPTKWRVYVGTFHGGDRDGIYIGGLDAETGRLDIHTRVPSLSNPSYINFDPSGRFLYAAARVATERDGSEGWLSAYAVDRASGGLTHLNDQRTLGSGACYVSVDHTGRFAFVAHYASGSANILPIAADGSLGEAKAPRQHEGSGPNARRQDRPHAHCILPGPDNRFVYVPDLGIDKVMIYAIDFEGGSLADGPVPWVRTHPGAGPRHITFHPNGRFAYVINELDSTISVFLRISATGGLEPVQRVSTLPVGFTGENHCADIHVHPSGRFVYGSNRGHDSIAVFAVDPGDGTLTPLGHEPTRGVWPRNFALEPGGRILLAANQNTDNIVTFFIDPERGTLVPTGFEVEVPRPVCIKLLAAHGE